MASGCLCSLLTLAFGPKTVPLFLGQSFVGVLLFESVRSVVLGELYAPNGKRAGAIISFLDPWAGRFFEVELLRGLFSGC